MGIEVINIGAEAPIVGGELKKEDLAEFKINTFVSKNPEMSIWLSNLSLDKPILPWWSYEAGLDKDIQSIKEKWSVTNAQNLIDLLYLYQLHHMAGKDFYVLFPGSIKSDGWKDLSEADKTIYNRGQSCVYHMEGGMQNKFTINWVPFYYQQSLVKNPPFFALWHMFLAKQDMMDSVNAISFFSLSDPKKLPEIIKLLINKDEERSEKMATLVNWFGLYSSPMAPSHTTSSVIYSEKKEMLTQFGKFADTFKKTLAEAQSEFLASPTPNSAFKILTKHVLL